VDTIDGPRLRRRWGRVLVAVLIALAGALGVASPAVAHDYLVSSSPADGSTITSAPSTVTLTFDAAVLGTGNGSTVVAVTGPGGKHFETACPVVHNDDVSAAVRLGGAGTYTVAWRIVSADGHPVGDSIRFRYAPKAGATAAPGSANGPSCGDAASRTGSAAAQDASSSDVLVLVVVVVGALVVLVVVVVVVALVLSRRRA
jgi:copper resistance protein C